MIRNRSILCMSNPSWEGDYAKTIVEIMRILVQENKVLYIENPSTWLDIFRLIMKGRFGSLGFLLGNKLKKIAVGESFVYVANPGPVLPINFLPHNALYLWLLKQNNRLVLKKVKALLRQLDMEKDLIHINAFNPMLAAHTLGKFKESVSVYYCYDEISAAHYMKNHGAFLEDELLQNADLTVVTSAGLYEQKKVKAQKIALVKNGVDFNLFSQAYREIIPQETLIGYIGSIDDRLDQEWLRHCFEAHPEWTFEFVGRINDASTGEFLKPFANVRLRGAHASSELPSFLQNYSVGIIPFIKNEFTRGIYPLKINEYLAAGLPVVLSDFGLLDEFQQIASICRNKETFLSALEIEVHSDSTEKRKLRREFARGNAWKARAEVLSSEIEKLENER